MSALHAPGSEHPGNRRQPNPPLGLIDRWAQLAVDRPWRYTAAWAIGIGAANLGLRMLLNDLSLARNAPLAILTAVGFLGFAWLSTAQLTRSFRGQRPRPVANPAIPEQHCAARWRSGWSGRRSAAGRGARHPGALVVPTTHEGASKGSADRQETPRPGGGAWSSPRSPSPSSRSPYLLVPFLTEVQVLGEVTMGSSQAGGIEGHQWTLHHTSGSRLPCRIVCECGWTSTAGQHSTVLLQLKGHLEDSLQGGARLIRTHGQASAELPTTHST